MVMNTVLHRAIAPSVFKDAVEPAQAILNPQGVSDVSPQIVRDINAASDFQIDLQMLAVSREVFRQWGYDVA